MLQEKCKKKNQSPSAGINEIKTAPSFKILPHPINLIGGVILMNHRTDCIKNFTAVNL